MVHHSTVGMAFGLACVTVISGMAVAKDDAFVQTSMLEDTDTNRRIEFRIEEPVKSTIRIDGEAWSIYRLGNESIAVQAGEPALPDIRRSVLIGATDDIDARLVDGSYYDIPNVKIAPSKGFITRNIDPASVPYTFGKVYDSAGFWPASPVSLDDPHIMRNTRGAVLTVRPLQWNPATSTLRVWTDMVVDVETVGVAADNVLDSRSLEVHSDNAAWETLYQRHYINYPAETRYDSFDLGGGMLIICNDAWLSEIQPLADHKNSIGVSTTVVGISTIGNSPANIEAYIDAMYDGGDLSYVLLVGDAQHISAYTSADNGLSDPIYAKMTADDYPEIFVGRFSAESAADVVTQVERTIAYEADAWTQKPEYMRALGIGSNQGDGVGDDGESDDVHIGNILTQLEEYGYTYTQGEYDPSGSIPDAVAALNDGIGTIAYCGHGSETCFGNGAPLCISDVNGLTNTEMLPWIVSVACVNGAYASGTCFAEAWLRATHNGAPTGAIGIYASTINQTWAPPMCAEDEIYDCYTAEEYTTQGVLFYAGSCLMMDEYGSGGVDMYNTWTIFGDPSVVVVGTAAPPTGMRVGGSGFAAEGPNGGPFAPNSCEFVLTNYEDSEIQFSVSGGANWLDFAPEAGSIPVGGEVIVSASLNANADGLPSGMHSATLSFVNQNTHDGDAEKGLSINVGVPVPVLEWTFDEDPGWSTEGEWAFGQPAGQGGNSYGNADPNSGATGNNVYGINLNGDYSLNVGSMNLTSSAIDCSNFSDTSVSFQRWLNCDYQSYAIETFEVSNNGASWTTLWENPSSSEVADSSWTAQEFDISTVADGEAVVYLRWTHAVNDFAWAYSGWNLDDVVISAIDSSVTEPCLGDADGSGSVGADDLLLVISEYGCASGCGGSDINGDGVVDANDLLGVVGAWGDCP
ncbi:MAG: hypothetical protein GY894_11805 [Planctomycetes bacterium]|nr:hypothetical protein [Planctomycetota bacterium]MCP4840023.1 hypothetical protein [Planctomycetota bacterium]